MRKFENNDTTLNLRVNEEFDKSESNKNILELIESLHKDTQKS